MFRLRHAAVAALLSAAATAAWIVPAAAAVPVGDRQVFLGNYDTGTFCQWSNIQIVGRNSSACGYTQDRYSAKVADGGPGHPTAARFELRDGDVPNVPGGERAEVRAGHAADVVEGDERWYQFSLKFDAAFPNPTGTYCVVMQWHPVSGPPPLAVEVSRAGNLVVRNARPGGATKTIGAIRRGAWVDYVLHVKFSNDPAVGFVEVAQQGTTVVARTPWVGMPTTSNYLKQGLYRDKVDVATAVVWHDDLRVTAPATPLIAP